MPRLLHVIRDLDHGGAATQLRLLAAASVARGEEVAVATLRRPGPLRERFAELGVPVVWTAKRFRRDPFAAIALRRFVWDWDADLLQSWDRESAGFCYIFQKRYGLGWLHTHRGGTAPWVPPPGVLVTADPHLEGHDGLPRDGRPNARSFTVLNAYDPAITPTSEAEKLAARGRFRAAGWDVADDAPVLACATRIDDAVATKEIAWASDLVRVVRPGLRLLVAGDGPGRLACERFAAKATERGTVQWLGAIDDLATLYAAADVVWVGRGAGAAPTPAVEAMAAGKPVVMADGPGRDALLPQDTSSATPPCRVGWNDRAAWAKATMRLLSDRALAADMGAANAQRVRGTHDVGRTIEAWRAALAMGSRS